MYNSYYVRATNKEMFNKLLDFVSSEWQECTLHSYSKATMFITVSMNSRCFRKLKSNYQDLFIDDEKKYYPKMFLNK